VLARFYELKTNRPLFITKGSRVSAAGLGSRTIDGYEISYDDKSVIMHYGVLIGGGQLRAIEEQYNELAKADPASIRRPDKLHGLSPWLDRPARAPSVETVKRILASMDERGAWVREGTIGKPDRVAFVYAARPMVIRIGRRASDGGTGNRSAGKDRLIQLGEDDTVEIFQGSEPPLERIIVSREFAENLIALSAWLIGGGNR